MRSKSPDMLDAIAGGGEGAGDGDRSDGAAEEGGAGRDARQPPRERSREPERSHAPTAAKEGAELLDRGLFGRRGEERGGSGLKISPARRVTTTLPRQELLKCGWI